MPTKRNIRYEPPADKSYFEAQNYKANDLVKEPVAAVLMGRHRVTLRVWRRQGRGCAYVKDSAGNILYRVGDIWDWAKANTIDPAKLTGSAENLHRLCRSNLERVRYKASSKPCGEDVFKKVRD